MSEGRKKEESDRFFQLYFSPPSTSMSSKERQFFNAAQAGDLSIVKNLAADSTLNVSWQEPTQGFTAFNYACFQGRESVVEFLLTLKNLDVMKPTAIAASPFFAACQNDHKEVAKLLLADRRIDVNKPTNTGTTPFFMACQGCVEVVLLLLADRIDVTRPLEGGSTPFLIACQNGHKEVVSLLLAHPRIDVHKPMDTGSTPFLVACQQGHPEVVSLLLADPRIDANRPANWSHSFPYCLSEWSQGSGVAPPG